MKTFVQHPVFKSATGLGLGFLGAFLGVFVSRVFLANNVDEYVLGVIFGVNGLTALAVVLAVEGFSSSIPTNVKNPLPYMRSMFIINMLFTVTVGLLVLGGAGVLFPEYGFMFEFWFLTGLGLLFTVFVGAGQMVEACAAVINKNVLIVWRRTSVQFIALLFFILVVTVWNVTGNNVILLVWFGGLVLGAGIAVVVSTVWLFWGSGKNVQYGFIETWKYSMGGYLFHHFGKLGIVLPRFIIPVFILALFGLEINTGFVVLGTMLGLLSVVVSAVSRGYMSHYLVVGAWKNMWGAWVVLFLIPAVLVFILSNWLVGLFGDGFKDLGGLLQLGVLGLLFYSFIDIWLAYFRVVGKVKLSSFVSILFGIVLVGGVLFGGGVAGLEGIMVAYLIIYAVFSVGVGFMFYRLRGSETI